jgi:multicomponent Na+:H+ antiporter subunit E
LGETLKYTISLGLVLFGVWLLWSGHYTAVLLSFGGVSCIVAVAIVRRMKIVDRESAPIEVTLGALLYLPWLLWEIVKANLDVARRILDPRLPISPRIIRVKAGQRHDIARVIYANSITLTPGTVSIDVEGDEITVHALTEEAARGVESGEMARRVTRLEGSS